MTKHTFSEIFDKYLKSHTTATKDGIAYIVARTLEAADIAEIHREVIEKGFINVNEATSEKQHMTLQEFEADVVSPGVLKFLAKHGEQIVAVMTVHIGLDRVVWTDLGPVKQIQNANDADSEPLYIGTLVVDPSFSHVDRVGTELIYQAFLEYFSYVRQQGYDPLIFFDCVWKNVPFIPAVVAMSAEKADEAGVDLKVLEYISAKNDSLEVSEFDSSRPQPESGHFTFVVGPNNLVGKL